MDKIRDKFNLHFKTANVQLPEPIPTRGEIRQGSWSIVYVVIPDEHGQPCLEFVANNRFTNSQHMRILNSGDIVPLPSWQEDFSFDPNVPGDREAAEARMNAHNEAVTADLQSKGLI
jgi:hypothetical protein